MAVEMPLSLMQDPKMLLRRKQDLPQSKLRMASMADSQLLDGGDSHDQASVLSEALRTLTGMMPPEQAAAMGGMQPPEGRASRLTSFLLMFTSLCGSLKPHPFCIFPFQTYSVARLAWAPTSFRPCST